MNTPTDLYHHEIRLVRALARHNTEHAFKDHAQIRRLNRELSRVRRRGAVLLARGVA